MQEPLPETVVLVDRCVWLHNKESLPRAGVFTQFLINFVGFWQAESPGDAPVMPD